jgi:hypothetical protein
MANRYEEFTKILEAAQGDFEKFYDKGVASAGTRVRKALQELTVLAKEVRKNVTEVKNERKAEKE